MLLSAKIKDGDDSRNFKDDCNTLDVSAAAGITYTFAEKFVLGARYTLGVTNLNKEGDDNFKNAVMQISFAYKF